MAEKKSAPKKGNEGKTVTVRQIKSANRKPDIQAQTLRGLGLGKIPVPARWKIRRRCAA
ncbi:MAG: Ribosomal protein L30p/L7e [Pseudomonadota bacterium]